MFPLGVTGGGYLEMLGKAMNIGDNLPLLIFDLRLQSRALSLH